MRPIVLLMLFSSPLLSSSALEFRSNQARTALSGDYDLASMISGTQVERAKVIPGLLPYLREKEGTLLEWARQAPEHVRSRENNFDEGLAEIFEKLKTVEAVPFLIEHIDYGPLYRWRDRAPTQVRVRMSYVRALVAIGPPALPYLMAAYAQPQTVDQRTLILLTIEGIDDPSTDVRGFLSGVRAQVDLEQRLLGRSTTDPCDARQSIRRSNPSGKVLP